MTTATVNTSGLQLPYLEQYFGVWACQARVIDSAVQSLRTLDIKAHLSQVNQRDGNVTVERIGNVAVVRLAGVLMKQESSLTESTSTVAARRVVRQLMIDETVDGVLLVIDSPGGTSAGTQELADDVAALAQAKPTHAFIDDLGASAAYWVASQTNRIATNQTGIVGSIGTYAVVVDSSKAAQDEGLEVFVVSSGGLKGAGVDGTEVTGELLAEIQSLVDVLTGHFTQAVSRGRGMNIATVNSLADGRIHVGAEALRRGLVDAVESFDQALSVLQREVMTVTEGRKSMAEQNSAASLEELKAALPKADNDFLIEMLEHEATVSDAKDCWIDRLESKAEADAKARADAEAKERAKQEALKNASSSSNAAFDKNEDEDSNGDKSGQFSDWNEAVEAVLQRPGVTSRRRAMVIANRENPGLREAFIEEYNQTHKVEEAPA